MSPSLRGARYISLFDNWPITQWLATTYDGRRLPVGALLPPLGTGVTHRWPAIGRNWLRCSSSVCILHRSTSTTSTPQPDNTHCKPKSGWNSPTQGEKEIIHPVDRWIQSGWKGWEFPVPYFTHSMDEFHKQFLFWLGGISSLLGTHTEDQIQPADRWNRTDILMVLLSCWMLLAYIG